MTTLTLGLGALVLFLLIAFKVAVNLRRVVPTNEVHIVQSSKATISYGKDTKNGNTYYAFPSWVPVIGITITNFPTSMFSLALKDYDTYDKDRLPFLIDIVAFFRIKDSNTAAASISSFVELKAQLTVILQGASRSVLAKYELEEILEGRSVFGEHFTKEVSNQLDNWGVESVKSIELMDIRDEKNSSVIANIMEKKKSHIEMQSRTEVAKNKQTASIAEIEATKEVDLKKANAKQEVGLRTVEAEQRVDLQNQAKAQAVKEQERITKEKEMAVLLVQHTKTAELNRDVAKIAAEQAKTTSVINAEATTQADVIRAEASKKTSLLIAEGKFEQQKREAEALELIGLAKAEAEKALLLAPVEAQTALAKEIGQNEPYQKYLTSLRQIEANQAIGVAQAGALSNADIKIISNTESPTSGLDNVMDLFSSKGGTQVGAMLQGLANTDQGKALLDAAGLGKKDKAEVPQ